MAAVKQLGYRYVSEYVYDQYYRRQHPISEIAKNLPITNSVVFYWMRRWGFITRPQGGNTKNRRLRNPKLVKKIEAAQGKMSISITARKYKCCDTTVRNIWRRREARNNKGENHA